MSVILLGYRGSGKTTVGRLLARRLGVAGGEFVDTDELIVRGAGMEIAEIFARFGESHFRDLEVRAVADALLLPGHVVSLGGGAVVRGETRELLKSSGRKRVYLRCDPAELSRRLLLDPRTAASRPSLLGGGSTGGIAGGTGGNGGGAADVGEIAAVLAVREPLYREVMTAELDVTGLAAEDAAARILEML